MAVPKRRTSRSKQGKRRSHQHATPIQIIYCQECNEPMLPHRVCPRCGKYRQKNYSPPEKSEKS